MNAIWIAVIVVGLLGLTFGAILGYASRRFTVEDDLVIEKIDETLPQSQYGQCGYLGCCPYAEAISCNGERISHCVPGGGAVMLKTVELLNAESQPLDGEAQEVMSVWTVAIIDENNYIGYTKYIQACPVDTIVGVTRVIHTVVSNLYMGCNLCVDLCPTHCTSLQPVAETPSPWKQDLNTIPVRIIPVEHRA